MCCVCLYTFGACIYKWLANTYQCFCTRTCVHGRTCPPGLHFIRDLVKDADAKAHKTFNVLDLMFTGIFTAELILNLVAHPLLEFFTDAWSVFDFVVVITSIFNMLSTGSSVVSVFRLFRLFRIIRYLFDICCVVHST